MATPTEVLLAARLAASERAVLSLLDVVEELAYEVSKDREWREIVRNTFKRHHLELRGLSEVE